MASLRISISLSLFLFLSPPYSPFVSRPSCVYILDPICAAARVHKARGVHKDPRRYSRSQCASRDSRRSIARHMPLAKYMREALLSRMHRLSPPVFHPFFSYLFLFSLPLFLSLSPDDFYRFERCSCRNIRSPSVLLFLPASPFIFVLSFIYVHLHTLASSSDLFRESSKCEREHTRCPRCHD